MTEVCVDACLVVKLVTREPDSDLADTLFSTWYDQGTRLIAPPFLPIEVDSVLRQKAMLRRELTVEQARACFAAACQVPIEFLSLPGQRDLAWSFAEELLLPHVYDTTYLALAKLCDCEFWTADQRLVKVCQSLPFVRWLKELEPGGRGPILSRRLHAR
jgi:predicted nucleic acid-binding protein